MQLTTNEVIMARKKSKKIQPVNSHAVASPLYPKNKLQQHYMSCITESAVTIATGYPGTGKTYIPARMAAAMYKNGDVENIIITRPNVSSSKSLGALPGTKEEKLGEWLKPITSAMLEEIPNHVISNLFDSGAFMMCPLEMVKGHTWPNSFIIIDEAEDLTMQEMYKVSTRIGDNSHMVFCGDTKQKDIQNSGLIAFIAMLENDDRLQDFIGHIDFNDKSQIVRSQACREIVLAFERAQILI